VGYFEFSLAFSCYGALGLGGEIDQKRSCIARQQNLEAQGKNARRQW